MRVIVLNILSIFSLSSTRPVSRITRLVTSVEIKNMVTLGFKPGCDFDVENRRVTFENNRSRYCWDRRHDSRC